MFESLEGRTLLSAVTVTVHKGILKIVGTPHRDRIGVSGVSGALVLTINGQAQTVQSRVRSVYFYGGSGSDTLDGTDTGFNYYVDAGPGNDSIYTGTGFDTVFGGRGDDTITDNYGKFQNDYQDGGPGDDVLWDGGTMNGGSGHDTGNVIGPYRNPVFSSGLEAFNTYDEYNEMPYEASLSSLKSDLSTHNGRLRFTYRFSDDEKGIIGPFIREDGKIEFLVRLRRDYDSPIVPPATYTLSASYTKIALSRGLVVAYAEGVRGQPILLPSFQ